MEQNVEICKEVEGFYRIIPLQPFRRTANVSFDVIPRNAMQEIHALDRVIHQQSAVSPGPVGEVERPWYMHPCQDDNLVVLHGTRVVDIFSRQHGRVETFEITPDQLRQGDTVVYDGPAMLVWPRLIFHRIQSLAEGSASLNLAVHYDGFDIRTNFNIYDLDTETGRFTTLREGHLDQKT